MREDRHRTSGVAAATSRSSAGPDTTRTYPFTACPTLTHMDAHRRQASLVLGSDQRLELGEGPVWDESRQRVWWVDSEAGEVYRGRLEGDRLDVEWHRPMGEKVGCVTPADDGGLLVAGEREVHVLDAEGEHRDSIRLIPDHVDSRLNDGTVDPAGRFLVGSIRCDDRSGQECVWSIDADRSVNIVLTGVTVSNGIGFSPDGTTMYHVETRPGEVRAFYYDVERGIASGQCTILDCGGTPDGLAVDVDGRLWVAFFGEGAVRCLTPDGDIVDEIRVAAPHVTCPEFVGPSRDRLLLTSARFRMSADALAEWPMAGGLFVTDAPVPGLRVRAWAGSTS